MQIPAQVKPAASGREVEHPARVPDEPVTNFGMLVSGVVVEDCVDNFAGGNFALDGIEKADQLLMGVPLHAAAEHHALQDVEGGEQGGGAVAFVIVGHGSALSGFER